MGYEGFYGRLPQLGVIESHGEPHWEMQHGRLHRPQSGTTDWREPVHALAYSSKRPDDDALQPLAHPPVAQWPGPRAVSAQRCDRRRAAYLCRQYRPGTLAAAGNPRRWRVL